LPLTPREKTQKGQALMFAQTRSVAKDGLYPAPVQTPEITDAVTVLPSTAGIDWTRPPRLAADSLSQLGDQARESAVVMNTAERQALALWLKHAVAMKLTSYQSIGRALEQPFPFTALERLMLNTLSAFSRQLEKQVQTVARDSFDDHLLTMQMALSAGEFYTNPALVLQMGEAVALDMSALQLTPYRHARLVYRALALIDRCFCSVLLPHDLWDQAQSWSVAEMKDEYTLLKKVWRDEGVEAMYDLIAHCEYLHFPYGHETVEDRLHYYATLFSTSPRWMKRSPCKSVLREARQLLHQAHTLWHESPVWCSAVIVVADTVLNRFESEKAVRRAQRHKQTSEDGLHGENVPLTDGLFVYGGSTVEYEQMDFNYRQFMEAGEEPTLRLCLSGISSGVLEAVVSDIATGLGLFMRLCAANDRYPRRKP